MKPGVARPLTAVLKRFCHTLQFSTWNHEFGLMLIAEHTSFALIHDGCLPDHSCMAYMAHLSNMPTLTGFKLNKTAEQDALRQGITLSGYLLELGNHMFGFTGGKRVVNI